MNTHRTDGGALEIDGREKWEQRIGDHAIARMQAEIKRLDYHGAVGCVSAVFTLGICMAALWGSVHGWLAKLAAELTR